MAIEHDLVKRSIDGLMQNDGDITGVLNTRGLSDRKLTYFDIGGGILSVQYEVAATANLYADPIGALKRAKRTMAPVEIENKGKADEYKVCRIVLGHATVILHILKPKKTEP